MQLPLATEVKTVTKTSNDYNTVTAKKTFRIGTLGNIREMEVETDVSVLQAIQKAQLDTTGFEIRHNGSLANPDNPVSQNDTILLVRKIAGAR